MLKKIALADKTICVACGVCAKECPKSAISVWKGCFAVVDAVNCIGCAKCAKVCPASCIKIEQREATV